MNAEMKPQVTSERPPNEAAPPPVPANRQMYRDYSEVPWHRKSGSNSLLILLNVLTAGFFPGTLLVCIFVLTGDVVLARFV